MKLNWENGIQLGRVLHKKAGSVGKDVKKAVKKVLYLKNRVRHNRRISDCSWPKSSCN